MMMYVSSPVESIYSISMLILPVALAAYMLKENLIISKYAFFFGYALFNVICCMADSFDNNVLLTILYTAVYYSYIFLVRGNRLNALTISFMVIDAYNIISNGIISLVFLFVSIVRGDGQWLDISTEGDEMKLFIIAAMYFGAAGSIFFGRWIRGYVYGLAGRKRITFFVLIPGLFMAESFLKPTLTMEYANSPAGLAMATDTIMLTVSGCCIVYLIVFNILNKRRQNDMAEEQMNNIKRVYDEMAEAERELRIMKHEIKNKVFGERYGGDR